MEYNDLAYAFEKPNCIGLFKQHPSDFRVNERLGFELSGQGEHIFLQIEKQNLNTEELIKRLAKCLNKQQKLISHAGLKDRQAMTTQWISVHCPGEEIEGIERLYGDGWRVISSKRHLKKLKIGGLDSNQFEIKLRSITDPEDLNTRLSWIKAQGVPNYFGPQRFGHQGQNLLKAQSLLLENQRVKDRFLRSIYYSAARSFLFNSILSARVAAQNWNKPIAGDVLQLAGSHSIFVIDEPDSIIFERVLKHDLSPASCLFGKGSDLTRLDAHTLQQNVLARFQPWCDALEAHGLEKAYRAHVLYPSEFSWEWHDDASLSLCFVLPPGAYATSVLRELLVAS